MAGAIARTGRQQASLDASAMDVAALLEDPARVTALLGDLIDQERSSVGPPTRWVVPRITLGLTTLDTVLVPRFTRDGDVVRIRAHPTPDSDAGARVELALDPLPTGDHSCRLRTTWRLELQVPLPRPALRLAAPAIDRTVAGTVQTIMRRTEAAAAEVGRRGVDPSAGS